MRGVYQRLRWRLRRIWPLTLTDRQASLLRAVCLHRISGDDEQKLINHIGAQLNATTHDRRVVAYWLGLIK